MQDKARADLARLFEEQLAEAGLEGRGDRDLRHAAPARADRARPAGRDRGGERGDQGPAHRRAAAGAGRLPAQDRPRPRTSSSSATASGSRSSSKPGRATADVLAEAIPAIVRAFPWPKSMRWGEASASTESPRWVRPLQGIVALLGDEVVEFEIAGISSGAATVGHRFHHPGPITIGGAQRLCREAARLPRHRRSGGAQGDHPQGRRQAASATAERWSPTRGWSPRMPGSPNGRCRCWAASTPPSSTLPPRADPAHHAGQPEIFRLHGRGRQRSPTASSASPISSRSDRGAAIVAGNEKVLAARLSDAKFFWEQDLKVPLAEQAKKLDQIVFHEKLGTIADKVERVAKLAAMAGRGAAGQGRRYRRDVADRRPARQGRSGHRDGRRVPRAAGRDRRLLCPRPGPAATRSPTRSATITSRRGRATRSRPIRSRSRSTSPTGSTPWSPSSRSARSRPARAIPFALRRAALGLPPDPDQAGLRLPLGDVLVQAAVLNDRLAARRALAR